MARFFGADAQASLREFTREFRVVGQWLAICWAADKYVFHVSMVRKGESLPLSWTSVPVRGGRRGGERALH